jgi:uncharacterized protein YutE (UPF0331/DUF86 family)
MTAARYNVPAHLQHLQESIKRLGVFKTMVDRQRFLSEEMTRYAILKSLEETLEIMLTIGNMIIADNMIKKPEKNDEIFDVLATAEVYPRSLAEKLWGAGGFRNILVHNYIDLNFNMVYDYLEKCLPIFKDYAKYIAKFYSRN